MDKDDDAMTALIANGSGCNNQGQDASATTAASNAKKKELLWFPHQRRGGVEKLFTYVVLIGFGYLLCLNMERVTFSFLPRSSSASRDTNVLERTTTTPSNIYYTTTDQQEGQQQEEQHPPPSVVRTVDTAGAVATDGDADDTKTTLANNNDDEGNIRNKNNKQKGAAGMLRTGSNKSSPQKSNKKSSATDVNKVQVATAASKAQEDHGQKEGDQEYKQEEGNQNSKTEQEDAIKADVVADDSAVANADDTSANADADSDEDFFGFSGPPFEITNEDRQPTSPPHAGPCSCYNVTPNTVDGVKCCERTVHVNHKFGSYLMRGIFGHDSVYQRHGLNAAERLFVYTHDDQPSRDVRKVLMARNIFEALISGYLYHKDGHECSHQPGKRSTPRMHNLTIVTSPEAPDPGDRDLCQYFVDESELDGLRMYAEWIFRLRYARYIQVFKTSLNDPDYPMHGRVRIVCLEDMTNPDTKDEELRGVINWLYPGGNYGDIPPLPKPEYEGNHATSHDPELHKRLRKILMHLDATEFHGQLEAAQRVFGCDKKH